MKKLIALFLILGTVTSAKCQNQITFDQITQYEFGFYTLQDPLSQTPSAYGKGDSLKVEFWQPLITKDHDLQSSPQGVLPYIDSLFVIIPRTAFDELGADGNMVKTGETIAIELLPGQYGFSVRGYIGAAYSKFADWAYFEITGAPGRPVSITIEVK